MNIESFRIHEDYVTTLTIFTLKWLASPGGTELSKPIEEMSKGELNVFFTRLRGINMAHCQFTKVHQ